jgi:hypothetical protein
MAITRCDKPSKHAAVDGVIRIAFDVDGLRGSIFGLVPERVPERVDDNAATDRATRTSGACPGGAGYLELTRLRVVSVLRGAAVGKAVAILRPTFETRLLPAVSITGADSDW